MTHTGDLLVVSVDVTGLQQIAYSGFNTPAVKLATPDGGEVVTLDDSDDSC